MTFPSLAAARAHFAAVDPVLAAATAHVSPVENHRPRDPYAALLRAIVGQQLSVKAAATIWSRFEAHFEGIPSPHLLRSADDDTLRSVGLSRQKAGYVRNVAEAATSGVLDEQTLAALSDAEVVDRLTTIKGVGRWTVEMILIFGMRRPDVFSPGDLGVQQAMVRMYGLEETGVALRRRMVALAEPWAPHRSSACRLLWAWHGGGGE